MRDKIKINEGWSFKKETVDTDWTLVNLPHTWNAIDGAEGFDYYKGKCFYTKSLYVSQEKKGDIIYLEFEGANSVAQVIVNGQFMGEHRGGFSTFRFDITDALTFGKDNQIQVAVDNTVVEDVYPQMADFTFFGGLYRDVYLITVNPVHLTLLDFGGTGVSVFQSNITKELAELDVRVGVENQGETDFEGRFWVGIEDMQGQLVAYQNIDVSIEPKSVHQETITMAIESPHLWHGLDDPYLYQVRVQVQSYNDVLDEVCMKTGLRYYEVDPEQGFKLNGQPYRLRGVSRHQDRINKGWAISEEDQREDMVLIQEVGANTIRLAHYQHSQFFYELCDEVGMVLWAEIPFISAMSKTDITGANPKQQMQELIRQNINHPSICFWGIQNEIQIGGDRPEVRAVVRELNALTKKEDPTRLTTMANVMFVPDNDAYNHMTDIIGYNKYYGWYQGQAEDFAPWLDSFHTTNPRTSLCISEYGAEGILKYHSETPEVKDYSEEYHALYHETVWKIFEQRPWLWATYVWNMFDFGANIRDEGGVKGRNNKGLVTYDRKIKKDAFYLYKAHWSKEKFVHILSKRFIEREQSIINVKVYSNCDEVTLWINGQLIETRDASNKVILFEKVELIREQNTIEVIGTMSDSPAYQYKDKAYFYLTGKKNKTYIAPEAKGGIVANWFNMPELEAIEFDENFVIPEGVYSTKDTIEVLLSHPDSAQIIHSYLGNIEDKPMFGMLANMTLQVVGGMEPKTFTPEFLYRLNIKLTQIKK